jgi:hypothetical protein
MTVYVVSRGEHYEGSHVVGIFFNVDDAIKAALAEPTYSDEGWVKDERFPNSWDCGCDCVSVNPYDVQGAYVPEVWK